MSKPEKKIINPIPFSTETEGYKREKERARQKREGEQVVYLIAAPTPAPPIIEAPPKSSSQPLQIEAPPNFTAPPKTEGARGFLRVPNELVDAILPTLRPSEQAVLLRLYRLSRGFNAATCTVSIGVLASRCHLKPSQTRACVKELVQRNLIRRLGVDLANPVQDLRGVTFEVLIEAAAPSNIGGGSKSGAPSESGAIKEKALKEISKGVEPSAFKDCPDCSGSGFYYPKGYEGGVAKCMHPKLK